MKIVADNKIAFVESGFGRLGEVRLLDSREISPGAVKDADVLLVRSVTKVDEALLKNSKVRFVGTATIGTDHVDQSFLESEGIGFASAPGCNANAVAEYIVAALLVLARRLGFRLAEKTLGVVGVGNVGSRVVQKAGALGMRVLQNDPPLARKTAEPRYVPLDALMAADIVTLHVPLTNVGEDATYHLFDRQRLLHMKPGSIMINTSRGAVIQTGALKQVLSQGILETCALDVWENEPNIDIELLTQASLATPHIAGYSLEGKVNATRMVYEAACSFFDLPVEWHAITELPRVDEDKIVVDSNDQLPEEILARVVQKCYAIEEDDRKLRAVLSMRLQQRMAFFEQLRSSYPLRREFLNRTVEMCPGDSVLRNRLEQIGFVVHDSDSLKSKRVTT